jgi:ribosomal protein S18 acetylase RimI-like enzyme
MKIMTGIPETRIPRRADEASEIDYSSPTADDFEALSRDKVPIRSMTAHDLDALVAIDKRITGHDRRDYFERRLEETLDESAVRVSLVADVNETPVGFIMARVDFGEFGQTEPEAVIDTIGVEPVYTHMDIGTALMSQLLSNLSALHVERVRTEAFWTQYGLMAFLERRGFTPSRRLALVRAIGEDGEGRR